MCFGVTPAKILPNLRPHDQLLNSTESQTITQNLKVLCILKTNINAQMTPLNLTLMHAIFLKIVELTGHLTESW